MQLYTPIDDIDRSIYIFCCNKRACSLLSTGWRIYRNQCTSTISTTVYDASVVSSASITDTNSNKKASIWDDISASMISEVDSLDDLNNLLQMRDKSLSKTVASSTATTAVAVPNSKKADVVERKGNNALPNYIIKKIAEPYYGSTCIAASKDGADDGAVDMEDDSYAISSISNDRIAQLIASYIACEDDTTIVEALNSSSSVGTKSSSNKDDNYSSSTISKSSEVANDKDSSMEGKLGRTDKKSKVEEYFQRRTHIESRQVMRYAYGGQPLWCTHPSPVATASACRGCHKQRVFECQLMPALLSFIPTTSTAYTTNTASSISSSADAPADSLLQQLLGHTVDFGVVAIYSCPDSCSLDCEEEAYVQPPADLT